MNAKSDEIVRMGDVLSRHNKGRLEAYKKCSVDIKEHYGIEQTVLAGGYGYRQILELVQNGADAILEDGNHSDNRIGVSLQPQHLYVANTGAPLSDEGIQALLSSHSSPKRGNQIGRFGLGFKSLLKLGGRIDIFTRSSGHMRFDPERCRQEIQKQFDVANAPGMRLAWPLDDIPADQHLKELMSWAESVVRVEIGDENDHRQVANEIASFPAEFLLFMQTHTTVSLDDGGKFSMRLNVRTEKDNVRLLARGQDSEKWKLVERVVTIKDNRAKADATHIHDRDRVPIAWAYPLDAKREEAGLFWAFFPTSTRSYVPGIINAPWKLNNDRNSLIGGAWNELLMRKAADLVAGAIPKLVAKEDPGHVLDCFPRQMDRESDVAAPLVRELWSRLLKTSVIPNANGKPSAPKCLRRHPRDNPEIAAQWTAIADSKHRNDAVHSTCLSTRARISRLNELTERLKPNEPGSPIRGSLEKIDMSSWLEAVATIVPERAKALLQLIEAVKKDCKEDEWEELLGEWVVIPSDEAKLISPSQAIFAPEGISLPDGRHPVAKYLAEDPESRRILSEALGVQELDENLWTQALRCLLPLPYSGDDTQWTHFWTELRKAPELVKTKLISEKKGDIRVRRRDGKWVHADEVLLPGELVPENDLGGNRNVLVDFEMHGNDTDMLEALGVTDCPQGIGAPQAHRKHSRDNSHLNEWLRISRVRYEGSEERWFTKPQMSKIHPEEFSLPNGWKLLPLLTDGSAVRLTSKLMEHWDNGRIPETVVFRHDTKEHEYPKVELPHPLLVILWDYGVFRIGSDYVSLRAVAARYQDVDMPELARHKKALSAIRNRWREYREYVGTLQLSGFWHALIKMRATPDALSNDSLHDFWCAAAKDRIVPESLNTQQGALSITDIYVTTSPDLAKHGRKAGNVVVTLDDNAIVLWLAKGASDLSKSYEPTWGEEAGPAVLLISAVPDIKGALTDEAVESAECLPVTGLKLRINDHSDAVPCLMWRTQLLIDQSQLSGLSRGKRLQLILDEISGAGWLTKPAGDALKDLGDSGVDELRAKVAEGTTLPERLLRAVGSREEPLRQALGTIGTMDFLESCPVIELAELVLAHHGVAVLKELSETLKEEGLKPPSKWNTSEARAFTAAIGFTEEYAGSPTSGRDPEEYITGPIYLPELHPFQKEVLEDIEALLSNQAKRRRAVVSLPTGGGKTRVTVEAVVKFVLKPERERRYVLWIAQADELCEQAVQAFRQVWLNRGAPNTELRIVRLWGGNPDPTVQNEDAGKPLVIVASIQTLNVRTASRGNFKYGSPGLVVADECHHAIARSYTNILRLIAPANQLEQQIAPEPPIIGLSATPFRVNDEESERLAKRFDGRWFPDNQERLHEDLTRQGVLAEADREPLESGVALTEGEIDQLDKLKDAIDGIEFERIVEQINQRMAGNRKRNETMIERIKQSQEQSILFFANSVNHAKEMAVRFNYERIPAAAISGSTPPSARRDFLVRFQSQKLRVLCNHSVLATGFDAPKTDMIMISRQLFSPVRYMQMVGRGLRGVKNGGTPRCKIVTVLDNLGRFSDKHPYHYCARYFGKDDTL